MYTHSNRGYLQTLWNQNVIYLMQCGIHSKIVPVTGTPALLHELKVGNKMVAKCFTLVQCKVILKLYWKFENVCRVQGSCCVNLQQNLQHNLRLNAVMTNLRLRGTCMPWPSNNLGDLTHQSVQPFLVWCCNNFHDHQKTLLIRQVSTASVHLSLERAR